MNVYLTALFLLLVAPVAARDLDFLNLNRKGKAHDFLKFNRNLEEGSGGDDEDSGGAFPKLVCWIASAKVVQGDQDLQTMFYRAGDGAGAALIKRIVIIVASVIGTVRNNPGYPIEREVETSVREGLSETQVQGFLYPRRSLECSAGLYDFGTNATAVEAYDTACKERGGQTLTINAYGSATCAISYFLRYPVCLDARLCSEEDVSEYADFFATMVLPSSLVGNDTLCEYTATVVSDGGNGEVSDDSQLLSVPETCVADMVNIFFFSVLLYRDFFIEFVIDQSTGEFSGNNTALEIFTELCQSELGRVVRASTTHHSGECDRPDLSSVPICVASTCDAEHSELVFNFLLNNVILNDGCKKTATFEGAGGPSSKSTKRRSKASKAPNDKWSKASKSTKGKRSKSSWEY